MKIQKFESVNNRTSELIISVKKKLATIDDLLSNFEIENVNNRIAFKHSGSLEDLNTKLIKIIKNLNIYFNDDNYNDDEIEFKHDIKNYNI